MGNKGDPHRCTKSLLEYFIEQVDVRINCRTFINSCEILVFSDIKDYVFFKLSIARSKGMFVNIEMTSSKIKIEFFNPCSIYDL